MHSRNLLFCLCLLLATAGAGYSQAVTTPSAKKDPYKGTTSYQKTGNTGTERSALGRAPAGANSGRQQRSTGKVRKPTGTAATAPKSGNQ